MKYFLSILFLAIIGLPSYAQNIPVDFQFCTGTGELCVTPSDSTYELCLKLIPGFCSSKQYEIRWGDGKTELITLASETTVKHVYDLRNFSKNCSSGEIEYNLNIKNSSCSNDNKGYILTFKKRPEAKPIIQAACAGSPVIISNSSCPTSNVTFLWEFSDGRTSTSYTPNFSFIDPNQNYKAKLTVTSKSCGASTTEVDFKLGKNTVPAFNTTGTTIINQDTVVCSSGSGIITIDGTLSTDETGYQWQISGGRFTYQDKTAFNSGTIKIKLEEIKDYTITLVTNNSCGNSRPLVKKIRVVNLPALALTPQPDVCEEISYKIANPVTEAEYTLNGKVINPSQNTALVFSPTPYIISAKLSNACGTQMVSDTFTVGPAQVVKILSFPKDTTICVSPVAIVLRANFQGGEWSTAGVEIRNGQKVFVPATSGDFTISYSNGVGKCFSKDEVHVKVDGIQAVAADQTICAGTPFVKLNATPAGGSWSTSSCLNCLKGDTLITSGITVNQVDLTYVVANATGCKATATSKVIFGRPKADFAIDGGCSGGSFQPKNTSSGAGTYTWLVNGASVSSEANPKLTLSSGLQKITLIARSGNCTDTLRKEVTIIAPPSPIAFTPSTSLGCSPLNVTLQVNGANSPNTEYSWDFGNKTTFMGYQPPSQLFENQEKQNLTFKITVTAKNACGAQSDSKDVVVRPKARAEIGVDSTTLRCTPAQLLFSNRSSGNDKDQSRWSFGDGVVRQTPSDTVYHSFAAKDSARTFRVKLEITSACGRDTASVDIHVYPSTVKALYTISKSVVCPGEEVRFTDASVPKPNRWIWKFGDGSISTLANPIHTFAQPQKDYKVTLVAFTSCGYDSTQLTVKTTEAVTGSFLEVPLACEGSAVQFVNKSDTGLGFVWDFGDGSPVDSSNYSPVHSYAKTGNYTATLSVYRGTQACKTVAKKTPISVVPPVTADFGFNGDSLFCAPGPVSLVNLSKNADTYSWYFSDGRMSNVKNPSLPFEPGMYAVKLVASKAGFCKDSVERSAAISVDHCQLDIPDAFTPNGDGFGDRYTFFGNGILQIDQLLIRNRWGEIVFEMKNVTPGSQQPGESWDGTFHGKPLPADMYVYEAVVLYIDKRKSEKLRGNIYLAR